VGLRFPIHLTPVAFDMWALYFPRFQPLPHLIDAQIYKAATGAQIYAKTALSWTGVFSPAANATTLKEVFLSQRRTATVCVFV